MSTTPSGTTPGSMSEFQSRLSQAMREHWKLFLIEGIILVILGVLAIVLPPIATLAVTIIVGWLFLFSGVAGLITTFGARHAPGFWWSLSGVITLTLLLIAFFIIEGILSIMYAIEHKNELTGQWGWMLASGIIDLVLAAMIWAGLPSTAAWAIGLLVGINMLFGGAAMIAMAMHARSSETPATTRTA